MHGKHDCRQGASDAQVFGRALGMGLLGLLGIAAVVGLQTAAARSQERLREFGPPGHVELMVGQRRLEAEPLTPELRRKGYHECNPHDPLGLGPYTPFRNVRLGRIAIPQRGGYTPDRGYDVLVHFHGQSAVRKTLVQVARGVTFVGVDKGLGSGRYSKPFRNPLLFPKFRRSIEGALRRHSGDPRAHIRHLALSAWSAGYGAINEILKRYSDQVDAVILLDGLHAAWTRTRPKRKKKISVDSTRNIKSSFEFARRAMAGEKIFIYTHSNVDPVRYPSTAQTADLLLAQLGLVRQPVAGEWGRFAQMGAVDVKGLHVWSYPGTDKPAHCFHISLIARVVRDILEPEWNTPPMDRNVPPTPAPKLGKNGKGSKGRSLLELIAIEIGVAEQQEGTDQLDRVDAPAPLGGDVDTAGLEPIPLRAIEPSGGEELPPSERDDPAAGE